MIVFALAAALMTAAPAPSDAGPPGASLSAADMQRWIDDQPEVRAYMSLTLTRGVRPPPADAFRAQPSLPRTTACRGSQSAMSAAVKLFQVSDQPKVLLTQPDLLAKYGGQSEIMLDEADKQALQSRARDLEQDAGAFEPACLG